MRVFLHEVKDIDLARVNRTDPVSGESSTEQMIRAYFETRPKVARVHTKRYLSLRQVILFSERRTRREKRRDRGFAAKSIVRLIDN